MMVEDNLVPPKRRKKRPRGQKMSGGLHACRTANGRRRHDLSVNQAVALKE